MRISKNLLAAAIAVVWLSVSGSASGDPLPIAGAKDHPLAAQAPVFVDVERLLAESRELGDAWSRAMATVVVAMRHIANLDQLPPVGGVVLPVGMKRPGPSLSVAGPLPVLQEVALRWDMVAPAPLVFEPVTASVVDVPGDHGVLLGVKVPLP